MLCEMPISILELANKRDITSIHHTEHFSSLPDVELANSLELQVDVHKIRHDLYDAHVIGDVSIDTLCDRCGNPFTHSSDLDTHILFADEPQEDEWQIVKNSLDLTEPIRQEILFTIPTKLLCRLDCEGMSNN